LQAQAQPQQSQQSQQSQSQQQQQRDYSHCLQPVLNQLRHVVIQFLSVLMSLPLRYHLSMRTQQKEDHHRPLLFVVPQGGERSTLPPTQTESQDP
jgi:hypothetical protein